MIGTETAEQYEATRAGAGIIVRRPVGLLEIKGADRFRWLQGMVSSDTRELAEGKASSQLSCILDPTGHILSNLTLVNDPGGEERLLVDLPYENVAKAAAILDRFLITEEVEITDISDDWGCISFQGPDADGARSLARSIWDASSSRVGGSIETPADHTGFGGWDWYLFTESVSELTRLLANASEWKYPTIDSEALEILRVEAGIPRYGIDIDSSVLAPEAGLPKGQVSLTKGCYVGQEIVARIDARGHTNRSLTGLVGAEGALLRPGDKLYSVDGADGDSGARKDVGWITSSIPESPACGMRPIALGYVRHEAREVGARLVADGDGHRGMVETAALPFYRLKNDG